MRKLKHSRCRLHSLFYMLEYIKDKQSWEVTNVISMAVVNPSTTTIHRPAQNLHETKKPIQIFFPLIFCIIILLTGAIVKKSERGNFLQLDLFSSVRGKLGQFFGSLLAFIEASVKVGKWFRRIFEPPVQSGCSDI